MPTNFDATCAPSPLPQCKQQEFGRASTEASKHSSFSRSISCCEVVCESDFAGPVAGSDKLDAPFFRLGR